MACRLAALLAIAASVQATLRYASITSEKAAAEHEAVTANATISQGAQDSGIELLNPFAPAAPFPKIPAMAFRVLVLAATAAAAQGLSLVTGNNNTSPIVAASQTPPAGAQIAPFGKEDTARELQQHAARTQDTLVDAVENAEVAEIKRAVFRALTRLRAAEIKEFDTIARLETQAIDEYNDNHHYRAENPLDYMASAEPAVSTDKYTSSTAREAPLATEIKRAVFRALTRLRAAEIKEFDTIARLETQAIDEYNDNHHYRAENPLDYIASSEPAVSTDKYRRSMAREGDGPAV
eukprot:CAMPEP_0175252916 /NCGR_PEP_ID=MMETSP0093-20121207/36419_1 /TAXON_ID=311494 /ORGANISM="Alexandrium monilatum, Strain CCMP3105" /LENGTH=293 /DNA_ID=CAMNT_0016547215 /DNA_START=16 /DNA_END=896 /DNA_ORIENTATION=+